MEICLAPVCYTSCYTNMSILTKVILNVLCHIGHMYTQSSFCIWVTLYCLYSYSCNFCTYAIDLLIRLSMYLFKILQISRLCHSDSSYFIFLTNSLCPSIRGLSQEDWMFGDTLSESGRRQVGLFLGLNMSFQCTLHLFLCKRTEQFDYLVWC